MADEATLAAMLRAKEEPPLQPSGRPDLSGVPAFGSQGFGAGLQKFGPELALDAALAYAGGPIPKMLKAGVPVAAAAMGLGSAQAGGTDADRISQMLEQQLTLRQQTKDALARREIERKSGEGERFKAADREFSSLNDQLTALSGMIQAEQRRNSPEYAMELKRKADADAEAARAKRSQTPTRELISDYTGYIPAATGLAALLGGAALKSRALSNFNKEVGDLSTRTGEAVQRAYSAPNSPAYSAARKEAQTLGGEFSALKEAGDKGSRHALEFGAGTGVVGAFLPEEIDFARAVSGSPLWGTLKENLIDDYPSTLKRGAIAAGLGAGVGHLGALSTLPFASKPMPTGYAAAADALPVRRIPRAPGGAGSPSQSGPEPSLAGLLAPTATTPGQQGPKSQLAELLSSEAPVATPKNPTMDAKRQAEAAWKKETGQHHIYDQNRGPDGKLLPGKKDD